ncbi:hypothetical protein [Paenarthrobacter aurescens]|uniref:DUF559 domain-containing protein n=1 Tax=Paenarthrobacter aurescens TaxID=43663 RepID=A0A4Y3N8P5_PAEAU|nr:hypothetical protein [Paenarthrobacter aurescens]MDO6144399.1 hypothetical protein [Paenarthrobacter aurescens]MDO6148246.1 hypothetical protein [Paenarthrobacter aurescens]MDO6159490.1 hypothetical protein [Paenarthrobacter aurescens]MDO6163473.1 hypothetical protein [Paenarthrobacter aurescens]GEB17962.1 hypothetical protein AAU01_07170 [Paenarthrobacter aurescens]
MQSQKLDSLLTAKWPNAILAVTSDLAANGLGDRELTAGARSGKLKRLRRGVYARTDDWRHLKPWEQDLLGIQAHQLSSRSSAAYSHVSAARLHGCSTWNGGPLVHITTPFSPSQASSGEDVVAHGALLASAEITEVLAPWRRPTKITSLERTVVDCARTLEFESALVIADQAVRKGADPLLMRGYVDTGRVIRGARRLRRVLDAVDGRSESVGETRARALLTKLGIKGAVPQLEVDTPNGRYRGDFGWPDSKVILEFDGRSKYFDFAPTDEVVFQERRREKALTALGWNVIRIEWADLSRPWEVERRLKAALTRPERRKPALPSLGSNGRAG